MKSSKKGVVGISKCKILTSQAQVLKVVHPLSFDQLDVIDFVRVHVSPVVVRQTALESHIVVLGTAALEAVLKNQQAIHSTTASSSVYFAQ